MTRLKYDGLPPGTHTFVYDEDRARVARDGEYEIVGQPDVVPGAIVEVEDLNDPKSGRARLCRGHLEGGLARVIEEKPKKEKPPAA